MKLPLLFLSLTALAQAQLTLYVIPEPGVESPVEGLFDVGATPVGDMLETRMRLRNTGRTAVTLTTLRVQGVAFSLLGHPTLPVAIAPSSNVDFRVRFLPVAAGAYSATLQANDRTLFLRGIALPAPRLFMERDGALVPVSTSEPVDFGQVPRSTTLARRFLLRNESNAAFTTRDIRLTGAAFSLSLGFTLPATLGPGETASFTIAVTPPRSGILTATLDVDGRLFRIDVTALDPPLPALSLELPAEPLESGRQARLTVRLAAPAPYSTTLRLSLLFTPLGPAPDDPAIVFAGTSARTVTVNVIEGETLAKVGSQSEILFQTGTTAGTITLRLEAGFRSTEISATIPAATPRLDSIRTSRSATQVDVACTGFDNTRSPSEVAFRFFDRNGRPLNAEPIRAAVAEQFRQYFTSSQLGGVFLLRAVFPVAGDVSQIGAVEATLTNAQGTSTPLRATF
jgi:hypothetical protein